MEKVERNMDSRTEAQKLLTKMRGNRELASKDLEKLESRRARFNISKVTFGTKREGEGADKMNPQYLPHPEPRKLTMLF